VRFLRYRAVRATLSYSPGELEAALRRLGIAEGDSIVMQSAFRPTNGFTGDPRQVIDCILDILGPQGNLFMVSIPYTGSARAYLESGNPFDVRRTPSMMGMLSESFRRRTGVIRSANPLHPVLAWGPRAEWVVAGHEDLAHSCGPGSPYEKMLALNTRALLFDVGLEVLTFTHYLEHIFRDSAPVPVYTPEPMTAEIITPDGQRRSIAVYPFSTEAMRRRNFGILYDRMIDRGDVQRERVGNTELQLLALQSVIDSGALLVAEGVHIYGAKGQPVRVKPSPRKLWHKVVTLPVNQPAMRRLARDGWSLTRRMLASFASAIRIRRTAPSAPPTYRSSRTS
jgi:aminoglycoside 3-N-acetyltransferase